jgi:hypothetical protein
MDLDKIIELAKELSKPYKVTTWILGVLLLVSILANVYLLSQPVMVDINANQNSASLVNQNNQR